MIEKEPDVKTEAPAGDLKRFIWHYLPALAYAALVFYVSSRTEINPPRLGFPWDDKVYHFGEYAIFSFFIFIALKYHQAPAIKRFIYLHAILISTIFAISDEIHQYFVPGRDSTLGDLAADSAGALAAQIIIWGFIRYRRQKAID